MKITFRLHFWQLENYGRERDETRLLLLRNERCNRLEQLRRGLASDVHAPMISWARPTQYDELRDQCRQLHK
jgi:hypothetical protein